MKTFTTKDIQRIEEDIRLGKNVNRSDNILYQGISNTRKSGINFLMTFDEMVDWSKCYNDIEYFTKVSGKIKLFEYQKDALEFVKNNQYCLFFTSRQIGLSIIEAFYVLHTMLFHSKKTLIIPYHRSSGTEFLNKIKNIYLNLPFFIKQGIIQWTKTGIEFENGSKIIIKKNIKEEEKSFIEEDIILLENINQEKIYADMMSKRNISSQVILNLNTIKGVDFCYDMIYNSERHFNDPKKNLFKTMRIYWWQYPGRDEKWKENTIKEVGQEIWDQEYDLCFKVSK